LAFQTPAVSSTIKRICNLNRIWYHQQ